MTPRRRHWYLPFFGVPGAVDLGGIRTVVTNPALAVAGQVNINNFGFEPNCGIVVGMGRAAQGQDKIDYSFSVGLWAGVGDERVCVGRADGGVTVMEEHFSHRTDAVHQWMNTSTTSDGRAQVHSTHADGVRLVTTEAYPGQVAIITSSFRATQAETGSFLEGDATMGVSFEPDCVFVIGTPTTTAPPTIDTASGSFMSYGWAHKAAGGGLTQFCASGGAVDNIGTSLCGRHQSLGGEAVALFNPATAAPNNIGTVTSLAGGGGMSWSGGGSGRYCHYLAIKGGQWHSENIAQPNGAADVFSVTGLPFAPEWAHGLHQRLPQGTDTSTGADFQWCHGHASRLSGAGGTLNKAHMQVGNTNGAGLANIARGWSGAFLNNLIISTPSGRNAADITSFNADGVTMANVATNEGNRRFVLLLAR